jgi:hypothetical protein
MYNYRTLDNRDGYILIKGKPEKLLAHLIEERDTSIDPYYVEDFLLVYRTFIDTGMIVFEKLLHWFAEPTNRDKVSCPHVLHEYVMMHRWHVWSCCG